MRRRLPDDLDQRSAPPDQPAADRFRMCPVCLQTYDTRSLDESYHHGPEPHAPYSGSRYQPADAPR